MSSRACLEEGTPDEDAGCSTAVSVGPGLDAATDSFVMGEEAGEVVAGAVVVTAAEN